MSSALPEQHLSDATDADEINQYGLSSDLENTHEAEALLLTTHDSTSGAALLRSLDKTTVLAVLRKRPGLLGWLSHEQRDDEELVTAAVSHYGLVLMDASPRLQHKKSVLLEAVKNDGFALAFAVMDEQLMDDSELFIAAAAKDGTDYLKYASLRVRDDDAVISECLKHCPYALLCASERIQQAYNYTAEDVLKQRPYLLKTS
jgi:hypothetical protein